MRKIITLTVLLISTYPLFAQKNFGIHAGLAYTNAKYVEEGIIPDTKYKAGFTGGAFAELPLKGNLFFRPELNFIQKGLKYEETENFGNNNYYKTSLNLRMNYVELPLHLVYKLHGTKAFLGAGPVLSLGLSGNLRYSYIENIGGIIDEDAGTSDIVFDGKQADMNDDRGHFKPIDIGFGLLGGYNIKQNIVVSAGYHFSFTNISVEDGTEYKQKGVTIKLGYIFPKVSK